MAAARQALGGGVSAEGGRGVTRALASFAAEARWEDVPQEARAAARLALLDCLGCAVAGHQTHAGRTVVKAAARLGGGSAPILGSSVRCGAPAAALANGILTYALDFEPVGPEGHVCAAVVPAAVTLGAELERSGREVLLALAIGLEVGGRVGVGVRRFPQLRGRPQTVRGNNHAIFGAAAAAGRLLGLDAERMAYAFGIAGYSAPPPSLTRCMAAPPVRDVKYDNQGVAAQLGLQAALLAADGLSGDPDILDGDTGFWRFTGAPACDWQGMLAGLGREWLLHRTLWFKPYPISLYSSPAVDALLEIVQPESLRPHEIERIVVFTGRTTPVMRDTRPLTSGSAGLSLACNLAAAALDVRPLRRWHAPEVYQAPELLALAERVELRTLETPAPPPRPPWEGWAPARVEVVARGRRYAAERKGLRRLTRDELVAKFHENAALLLPAVEGAEVVQQVEQLERAPSFARALRPLLAPSPAERASG